MAKKRAAASVAGVVFKTALIAGAAFLGSGELLYQKMLSRAAVNKKPDERLSDPEITARYKSHDCLREADDWYMSSQPVEHTLVSLRGETLHSEIIMAQKPSDKWLVCLHGWTSCPRSMAIYGHEFWKHGYNILFPYLRGHRKSEQDYVSMGMKDRLDVVDWINYVITKDPDAQIVLHGVSMGSATVMMVTGEFLPVNVKCAIADCGYTSALDEFTCQAKAMYHLPPHPLMEAVNTAAILHDKADLRKCSSVDAVTRSKTPTVFIHGAEDKFVPVWMLDVVYDACCADKEKLLVPDAEHAESAETHPEIYWPAVWGFVDKYVK